MPGTDPKVAPPPPPIDPDADEIDASDLIFEDSELLLEDDAPLIEAEMSEEATFLDDSGQPLEFRSVNSESSERSETLAPQGLDSAESEKHEEPLESISVSSAKLPASEIGGDTRPGLWIVSQVLGGWLAIVAIFIMTGIWAFTSRTHAPERDPHNIVTTEIPNPRASANLEATPSAADIAVQPSNVEESDTAAVPDRAATPPPEAALVPKTAREAEGTHKTASRGKTQARAQAVRARVAATKKTTRTKTQPGKTKTAAARSVASFAQADAFAGAQAYSAETRAQLRMVNRARGFLQSRDYAKARKQAQRYLDRYPDGDLRRAAFLVQLRALQRDKKKQSAAKLAKTLSAQSIFYGRLGEILRVQAEAPLARGDCDAARSLLVRALQLRGSGLDEAKIEKQIARCRARHR